MKKAQSQPWVAEDLVIVPMQAQSAGDAITQLGSRLLVGGFVKESWVGAALEREKTFATGLPTPEIGVAIPHADVEHVLKQGIAVGVLSEPVPFGEMGNPDGAVPVTIVCALAVSRSELMVSLLQRLVEIFQDAELLRRMAGVRTAAEMVEILEDHVELE